MDTIMIMAQALSKASRLDISRLDIQYNEIDMDYIGYVFLERESVKKEYVIGTNGNCSERS